MSNVPGVPEGHRIANVIKCDCGCDAYIAKLERIPKPTKQVLICELDIREAGLYGYGTCTEHYAKEMVKRGLGRIEEREA